MIRTVVTGVTGRMGSTLVRLVGADPGMEVVGGTDRTPIAAGPVKREPIAQGPLVWVGVGYVPGWSN